MKKTIEHIIYLIKKSYDQPIIFHLLYSKLASLISDDYPLSLISDTWSKIAIYSCYPSNKISNISLDAKILGLLKNIRPPFNDKSQKLKLMMVCYYLSNKPASIISNTLLFELISYFTGIDEYSDSLILTSLSKIVTAKVYGIQENKKTSKDAIERMLEIIKTKDLSETNKIKSIICFSNSEKKPFKVTYIDGPITPYLYKILEYSSFYAKYSEYDIHIKSTLPETSEFIQCLCGYIKGTIYIDPNIVPGINSYLLENTKIFEDLCDSYRMSSNKEKFLSRLLELIEKFSKEKDPVS